MGVNEIDGSVSEKVCGVLASRDVIAPMPTDRITVPRIVDFRHHRIRTGGVIVAGRNIPVVAHTAEEDFGARIEATCIRVNTVVPFPGAE